MNFAEKYDPENPGVTYIFNKFYSIIGSKPLRGNMLATPGENLDRYLNYVRKVCFKTKGRAIFLENYEPRYKRLKARLRTKSKKIQSRVRLIFGNAEHYELYTNIPKSMRLIDLGFGLGVKYMLRLGTFNLMKQVMTAAGGASHTRWKAHILDSSFRQVRQSDIIELYQGYVSCIPGLKIKRINGFRLGTKANPFSKTYSREVMSYKTKNGRTGKIYKHNIELESSRRQAELHIYTCLNGSQMMSSLLMYK